jgi:hypothetical protein
MKNLVNLIIKMALITVILALLIPVYGASTWTQTIITAAVLTLLSYILSDLWILPKYGNLGSLIADLGLSVLTVWAMARALPQFELSATGLWVIAVAFTVGEWLYHYYLLTTRAFGKGMEER